MIRILRPAAPGFLTVAGNKWQMETNAAIAHYAAVAPKGNFKYKTYNDEKLKAELKKIFVKCAYCESKYDQVSDGDIEHFRPKGEISEKDPKTPGYYWLANDWENLLLSCQHCNQRRKHKLVAANSTSSLGKMDQFPLRVGFSHVNYGQPLALEEPGRLLINPCVFNDNPESHFEYDKSTAAIFGITDMGIKSIEVYALLRPYLVAERNERRLLLFKQMEQTKFHLDNFNRLRTPESKSYFDGQLDNLLFYGKTEQPYAGMCRFFIKKFLFANNI